MLGCIKSIYFSTSAGSARTRSISGFSSSVSSPCAGTSPPKYFSIIATVRLTRLPRSFARSELIRPSSAAVENSLSDAKLVSRSRK